jgi:hypothetical protein
MSIQKKLVLVLEKCTQKKLFAKNFCETVIEGDKNPTMLNYFGLYRSFFDSKFIAFFSTVFESA